MFGIMDKITITLPTFDQVFKHRRGHRFGYWKFHEKLNEWAKENTRILRLFAAGEPVEDWETYHTLHIDMLELYITDYAGWATLTIVCEKDPVRNLEELEKRLKEMSVVDNDTSAIIRHTVASDFFVELSRTHFINMHRQLLHESAMIAKLDSIPDGKNFKVLWSLDHADFFYTAGGKPIMAYKQSEVVSLLFHLTERLDSLTMGAVEELRHILLLVYTRNSVFFCQKTTLEILDYPRGRMAEESAVIPSREYMVFCSIYFHALQRRLYMYDTCVRKNVPRIASGRFQHFVEHEIKLGSETFEEEYKKACEEAYVFPGDLEWFKYQNPDMPVQIGSILDCYRKEMAKRYYTTYRISQDVVLAAAQQPTHSGHASRIFIVNIVDQYLRIHYKIPWKDGIVIRNGAIESNEKKLFSKKTAPFLVQVCSRLWVYSDKVVYMTDDIYEAITFWLYLLRENYGGKLFGVDINEFIDRILKK